MNFFDNKQENAIHDVQYFIETKEKRYLIFNPGKAIPMSIRNLKLCSSKECKSNEYNDLSIS